MGAVYRATDTRLGREVALKIVPEKFAQDPQRMSRFQREAKVLASLDHPHISTIYGLEVDGDVQALVLELVEGPTLAERIAKGPIPTEEALAIALEIAQAVEAAHEKGIVHRDLKPANVKITPQGKIKVLDFGLAKALEPELSQQELANSPTLTLEATQEGMLLGTAAYMSPEQARGKQVDQRTDIWAFGCVLLECLTGEQQFGGETISDSIAKILQKEPGWERLPKDTPLAMRKLLRRCLEKDPHDRVQHIGDARIEIRHVLEQPSDDSYGEVGTASQSRWQQPVLLAVIGLLVVVGFFLWSREYDSQPAPATVTRFPITLPADEVISELAPLALSPDGAQLAYGTVRDNTQRLYLRPTDQLEAKPIPGSEGGWSPFFSPDGQWVGFFSGLSGAKLKKWSLLGGKPVTICEVGIARGAAWGEDGTIILGKKPGLWRVSSSGGIPEQLIPEGGLFWPQFLPGGKEVLFGSVSERGTGMLSLDTGQQSILLEGQFARYLPPGYLIYPQGGSLMAAPFDLDALQVRGSGVPVVDGVWMPPASPAKWAVSRRGALAYVPGSDKDREDTLVWVDRQGVEEPLVETQLKLYSARLSPDGKRLAVHTRDSEGFQIWGRCE